MSLALARKYRPKNFGDLVGQEVVSQTLSLALDSNRLTHAYLFSGLRGSGKTSTARIFAKALVCERGVSSTPCEVCINCIMANELRHMDIIEMDGASNRKIDDIRELIEHTKYKPSSARYKIFIIDEVHMLTKEAFNALLKTLEEPPEFIKFILATTDPLKLPATILSRTQHFRFKKISQSTMVKHLMNILESEGIGYDRGAVDIVARVGAGSIRDALTLLDQAIIYSQGAISVQSVTDMLGIIEPSQLEAVVDAVLNKDRGAILEFISNSSDFDIEMIIDELMIYLKDALLSGRGDIPPKTMNKLFKVLAEAKSLLSLGSGGEFVLALTLFQMMNSVETQKNLVPQTFKKIMKEMVAPPSPQEVRRERKVERRDEGLELFQKFIEHLEGRDEVLGKIFKNNIEYVSFESGLLKWKSMAEGEDRKILKYGWGTIKMFVKEIFGIETKIKNIQKREVPTIKSILEKSKPTPPPKPISTKPPLKRMEDEEVLKEPMVIKAMELFKPKNVKIEKKR